MKLILHNLLAKVFRIRPDERRRAVFMQLYIFLIILTLLIVKPTANGLFLNKFGVTALPYAFILMAILAAIVSSVYARLLRKTNLQAMIRRTLAASIISLLSFGILLNIGFLSDLILYLFYLWVLLFALVTTSQFWVLANLVFNSREAKRLFGFIGAGAIAGGIFGGYLASFLAQFMDSENLIFVAAITLLPCFYLLNKIWTEKLEVSSRSLRKPDPSLSIETHRHPIFLIFESRHLTYTAAIVGIGVMVAKLIDYQFSAIAADHYPDKEDLTAFFGFWFSTFNVVSLVLQLFLTRKIMESIGVSKALYLLPGLLLVVCGLMIFMPEVLLVAVAMKMVDGSLKQSVNKAAMELLILPVPGKVKNAAKTFIDVFVDSLATGLTGILLIFVVRGLHLSTVYISIMILVLTLGWIILIVKIRKEYLHAFKLKIEDSPASGGELVPTKLAPIFLPYRRLKKRLEKVIQIGSEKQIIQILEYIKPIRKAAIFEQTSQLLEHPSSAVRAAALRNINLYKEREVLNEVEDLLEDDSVKVQVRALDYLLRHDTENRLENIEQYLGDEHYKLRGVALVHLAEMARTDISIRQDYNLDNRLHEWFRKIKKLSNQDKQEFRTLVFIKAIGKGHLTDYYGYINRFLSHDNPRIIRQAILSAGETKETAFIRSLLNFLLHEDFRIPAQNALRKYDTIAFSTYKDIINHPDSEIQLIRAIPEVIKKIKDQRTVTFLTNLLSYPDFKVRQTSLRGLNRLRLTAPEYKYNYSGLTAYIMDEINLYRDMLSVIYAQRYLKVLNKHHKEKEIQKARKAVINILTKRLDQHLERVFLLLGLQYDPRDMMTIYRGIRSSKKEMRINALEFLDNLLTLDLKKIIIPIIETVTLEKITTEAIEKLKIDIPDEQSSLQKIIHLDDPELNRLIGVLEEKRLKGGGASTVL